MSDWIVDCLRQAGLDTPLVSGVCACNGGLSTAIEAGVPEVITWMQLGRVQDIVARRYVELESPKLVDGQHSNCDCPSGSGTQIGLHTGRPGHLEMVK